MDRECQILPSTVPLLRPNLPGSAATSFFAAHFFVAKSVVSAIAVLVAMNHLLQTSVCASSSDRLTNRPNIVLILADDMGYGDVQSLNPKSRIPTPHLNRLAASGMTFTDAHTPSAVCTPTRYGLLTGRYCWRSRLKRGVLNGYGEPLIERERATVASLLSTRGYITGIVGKWHLGLAFARRDDDTLDLQRPISDGPNQHGFDYSYVIPASLDFPPYVYIENGHVTRPETVTQAKRGFPAFLREGPRSTELVMEECLDHLLQKAVQFVDRQVTSADKKPFFLYFPLTAPHKPVLPHPRFRGQTDLGPYGDFVVQVDWTVGQLLEALDRTRAADNTLVIYTSDNGSFMYRRDAGDARDHVDDETEQAYRSDRHTSNHVFRGTKADIWEAGHHVPFFARWPGKIEPGSTCSATICLTDFFVTAADIVDGDVRRGAAPDSYSILPLLEGKSWRRGAPVIHHSSAGMFAIRDGDWKLVLGNGSGGRETPRGKPFEKPYQLYNLAEDISETQDRFQQRSEVAARLEQALEELRQ